MNCKVAKIIDQSTLVLNAGTNDKVSVGDRFLVYTLGEDVTDPDSGESLGQLEILKGSGRVTNVQERMCTIVSDMKSDPTRTIRRNTFLSMFPQEEITLSPNNIPFDNPGVGDLARQI